MKREDVIKAINDEPEYPGRMPDEVWELLKNDRDAMTEALRFAVQLTKQGIRERIGL